ncbi:MAG: hypothetical protein AAGE93_14435, partial [Bacteroidota bacterium]
MPKNSNSTDKLRCKIRDNYHLNLTSPISLGMKKWVIIALIGSFGLSSCRSSALPCPKIAAKQQQKGLFSKQGNGPKYDKNGRVKE